MPTYDVSAAKAELLAEAEPITLRFQGRDYEFPGAMPAEFEIEQMAIERETRDRPADAPAPEGAEQRIMRAAFGQHYEELNRTVPPSELVIGLGMLTGNWVRAFQDPNLGRRLMDQIEARTRAGGSLNLSSSTASGPPLRETSSASTASTSARRSSVVNGSRGGASPPSTAGSAPRR